MTTVTTPRVPAGTPAPATRRRRPRKPVRLGTVLVHLVLIALAVVYIYPFLVTVATSFKTDAEAASNAVGLIPQTWTTAAYERLLVRSDFPTWFKNSVVVTVVVTLGRVFFDSLAGYALARLRFRGRGLIFAGVVAVMAVPGVVLLIPRFLVINQLGMYDTYAALIIPDRTSVV